MFDKFLGKEIAIAGVDVSESYGNLKRQVICSALYKELVEKRGLAKQACLLAQSCSGLMLYNWAAKNPAYVARVTGIYPVCNFSKDIPFTLFTKWSRTLLGLKEVFKMFMNFTRRPTSGRATSNNAQDKNLAFLLFSF